MNGKPVPNRAARRDAILTSMGVPVTEAGERAQMADRAKFAKVGIYGPTYNAQPITDENYIPSDKLIGKKKKGKK
jgi:hypothetical protein